MDVKDAADRTKVTIKYQHQLGGYLRGKGNV